MKKFITLLILFVLTSASILLSSDFTKKIILEQHTGAWCGWCVDGTVVMDEILTLYPDKVIGVKVHNGDAMVIPEQAEIASTLKLGGYPNGNVDRKPYNGNVFISRGDWKAAVEALLEDEPKVGIELFYEIDETTRILTATVVATILEPISDQISFNVMICENNCTGTGNQWDQSNYLSGRAGYENNPYYTQPSVITGYHHMKVVRAFLGGAWGVSGNFGNGVEVGNTYTHEFTYTLPENWKIEDIFTVGTIAVNTADNKEFLNSCYGVPGKPRDPVVEVLSNSAEAGAAIAGQSVTRTFTLKNLAPNQDTYNITVTKTKESPADWSVNSSVSSVSLAPGAEQNFDVSVVVGQTKGFGAADILISSATDASAPKAKARVGAISGDIEYFEIINNKELEYTLDPYLNNPADYLKVKPGDIASFHSILPNIKNIIWNCGSNDVLKASDGTTIKELLKRNVNMIFIGYNVTKGLKDADVLADFGLEYFGYSEEGVADPNKGPWNAMINGVENDLFTSQWASKGFGIMRNSPQIHVFKVKDENLAHPSMTMRKEQVIKWTDAEGNPQSETVEGSVAKVSAWLYKGNSKIMILGVHPNDLLSDVVKEEYMVKPLEWFDGAMNADDISVFDGDMNLILCPNPISTSADIYYEVNENTSSNSKLSIFNTLGQEIVVLHTGNTSPGRNFITYKPDGIPNGAYFLVLSSNSKFLSIPVIINK